jgi:hypothetical protein
MQSPLADHLEWLHSQLWGILKCSYYKGMRDLKTFMREPIVIPQLRSRFPKNL